MNHSLGVNPVEYPLVRSSKVCGSCHSVVLPVFDGDHPWVEPGSPTRKPEIIIEQATYPEWVFSDFRDGGPTPMSCQNRREGLGSAKLPTEELARRVLPDLPDGQGGEVHDPWYEPKAKGGWGAAATR